MTEPDSSDSLIENEFVGFDVRQRARPFSTLLDALDVTQALRHEPARARLAEEHRPVPDGEPQHLRTAMNACLPVLVHSTEMGKDNATELSVLHRLTGRVDDFDENVPLAEMEIPGGCWARNGE